MSGRRRWSYRKAGDQQNEQGIALVAVLWGVLLLSTLATTFAVRAGTEARLAGNFVSRMQAAHLADAGVFWGVHELLRPVEERRVAADGSRYAIRIGEAALTVLIQDEAGKVDLNRAPPELITRLFAAAGADAGMAERLAAAVADWRDADDLTTPGGAEWQDYAAQGFAYGPRNAPFVDVEELRSVLGMTSELFADAAPYLTVHSGATGVDPTVASRTVLRALGDNNLPPTNSGTPAEAAQAPASEASAALVAASRHDLYTMSVSVDSGDKSRFVRTAVVLLTGMAHSPYRFLAWSGG